MSRQNETRVIIGETERAGWPLSAPLVKDEGPEPVMEGTIRFDARSGKGGSGYFALQQYRNGKWVDVHCVDNPDLF